MEVTPLGEVLGAEVIGIEEMDPELPDYLLRDLFEVASQPSNIYRHK